MAQIPTSAESEAAMLAGFRGDNEIALPDGMEDVPVGRVECPQCKHEFDSYTHLVTAGPRPIRVTE